MRAQPRPPAGQITDGQTRVVPPSIRLKVAVPPVGVTPSQKPPDELDIKLHALAELRRGRARIAEAQRLRWVAYRERVRALRSGDETGSER
jgi:hypothetical protein